MCSSRSARSGSSISASRWRSSCVVGLGLALQDQRLVEVAVAQLAGVVGDHRVAALGGQLEPVEHAAELVADGADELVGALQAPLEDRHHRGAGQVGALLGDEQAVARLLERGRAVEAVDAVVGERALRAASTKRSGSRSALASSERRNACRYSCGLCSSSRSGVVAGAAQRAHVA